MCHRRGHDYLVEQISGKKFLGPRQMIYYHRANTVKPNPLFLDLRKKQENIINHNKNNGSGYLNFSYPSPFFSRSD